MIGDVTATEDDPPVVIDLSPVFADIDDPELFYIVAEVTNPAVTTEIVGAELRLRFIPDGLGEGTVTLLAIDAQGASVDTTFSVTVAPVNDPPIALPTAAESVGTGAVSILISGVDVDDCELDFAIASPPQHGQLDAGTPQSCSSIGVGDWLAVAYQPEPGFVGSDSFSFTVTDGNLVSEPATVLVSVLGNANWMIRTVLPPDFEPGTVTLRGGQGETLEGLESIDVTTSSIRARIRPTCGGGPNNWMDISNEPRQIQLAAGLEDGAMGGGGMLAIPPGCVSELRLVTSEMTIALRGEVHPVSVPSGSTSGIKLRVEGDGVQLGDTTTTLVTDFNPFDSLLRNAHGFKLAPPIIDVRPGPSCGDGTCNTDETCITCPMDCEEQCFCGNGTCDPTENCSSCSDDCGSCCTGPDCGTLVGHWVHTVTKDGEVYARTHIRLGADESLAYSLELDGMPERVLSEGYWARDGGDLLLVLNDRITPIRHGITDVQTAELVLTTETGKTLRLGREP